MEAASPMTTELTGWSPAAGRFTGSALARHRPRPIVGRIRADGDPSRLAPERNGIITIRHVVHLTDDGLGDHALHLACFVVRIDGLGLLTGG